jgi:biopolymer transport protein ExbB
LLGLLGAISGLITIFSNVNATELSTQGAFIAQGIAEALHTTVAGLVIAIPALVAHSIYSKKIENLMIEMEGLIMDLTAKLYLEPDGEK